MNLDVVEGYEVQKSVLFSNGKGMALAENPAAPEPYVTWQFTEAKGKRDYYWGHYFADKGEALRDFTERVEHYKSSFCVSEVSGMNTGSRPKKPKEPER